MFPRLLLPIPLASLPLLLLSNLLVLGFVSTAQGADSCRPSSCGNIRNISYPFRLEGDPIHCGDPLYQLRCRNNQTLVNINSHDYFVKQIFYESQRIQIVDASLKTDLCSSFPLNFSLIQNFYQRYDYWDSFDARGKAYMLANYSKVVVLVTCPKPILHPSYIKTGICKKNKTSPASYVYTIIDPIALSDFPTYCDVVAKFPAPVDGIQIPTSTNVLQILLQGFELSWKEQLSCRRCFADHHYCIDYLATKYPNEPLPTGYKKTAALCIDLEVDYGCGENFSDIPSFPLWLQKLLGWLACHVDFLFDFIWRKILKKHTDGYDENYYAESAGFTRERVGQSLDSQKSRQLYMCKCHDGTCNKQHIHGRGNNKLR